jgi:HlyD family secretion protein
MKLFGSAKTKGLILGVVLVIVAAASYLVFGSTSGTGAQFKLVSITKGNIERTISSSGTLSPVTMVEVGTQVSGIIDKIYVDFNDRVTRGQVLAVLDTGLLRLSVTDAQSGFMKAEAALDEALTNHKRSVELFQKGMLSESEFQAVKTTLRNAQASMTMAQSALERSAQNLKYAIVKSPINGTVTARNVEAGQTVAASFSTPTLFTIAQDLSKMEIKALVDESDIGEIKEGMAVRFGVQAYPKNKFEGKVRQVRVQPTTASNVVNYTVVISADNKDNLLLPGMTATVDFVLEQSNDVLLVPNSALRFQPSEKELTEVRARMRQNMLMPQDSAQRPMGSPGQMGPPPGGPMPGGPPPGGDMEKGSEPKFLWHLDSQGKLAMIPVRVGITDGTNTQIMDDRFLKEGMQVISGSQSIAQKPTKTNSGSQGGPPGPPMF